MNSIHKLVITLMITFCMTYVCWADQIGLRIGPFNFREWMNEEQLIATYGEGFTTAGEHQGAVYEKKHTYYCRLQNVWLEIRMSHVLDENHLPFVEEVLVTKKELCDKRYEPKKPFHKLSTGSGIKIGDSLDKVIKAYRKPSDLNNYVDVEGPAFRYVNEKELGMEVFHFKDGKVYSILISVSE